jgi:uncharacterized protein YkwD
VSDPLRVRVLLASVVALVAVAAPATAAAPRRAHVGLSAQALLAQINVVRAQHGLKPIRFVRPLRLAAGAHSEEMGTRGYFAHESADGTSFWKRVGQFYGSNGYRFWSVGENLLWSSGTITPEAAVSMWMNSPPHRKNLLDRHWRQIGLSIKQFGSAPGVYRGLPVTIVTADFGVRY